MGQVQKMQARERTEPDRQPGMTACPKCGLYAQHIERPVVTLMNGSRILSMVCSNGECAHVWEQQLTDSKGAGVAQSSQRQSAQRPSS